MLYLQSGRTQSSPLKRDCKAGPPGHKDPHLTFVLMEIAWPQSSPLDMFSELLFLKAGLLLLLFEVQNFLKPTCGAACNPSHVFLKRDKGNVELCKCFSFFHSFLINNII